MTEDTEEIIRILSAEVCRGLGPSLAAKYLAKQHKIKIARSTLRDLMITEGMWPGHKKSEDSPRARSRFAGSAGKLVRWDAFTHDWLEGRGPRLCLIYMIDDATNELLSRFVVSDLPRENLRMLEQYLRKNGRPLRFVGRIASPDITRALRQLEIVWKQANSADRRFWTIQKLVLDGLRAVDARTLDAANRYLNDQLSGWWKQQMFVSAANPSNAHRPLSPNQDLPAILSVVRRCTVGNDYTIEYDSKRFQIMPEQIWSGLRGSSVHIESRLDGTLAVRMGQRYLEITEVTQRKRLKKPRWNNNDELFRPDRRFAWQAAIMDRTRISDELD